MASNEMIEAFRNNRESMRNILLFISENSTRTYCEIAEKFSNSSKDEIKYNLRCLEELNFIYRGDDEVSIYGIGHALAYVIKDNNIWNQAVAHCEECKIYSFNSVVGRVVHILENKGE